MMGARWGSDSHSPQGRTALAEHRLVLMMTSCCCYLPGIAGSPTIHRQAAPPAAALRPRLTRTAASIPSVNITWQNDNSRAEGQQQQQHEK